IKEPVSARGWIAVLFGFLGVVVLLQPGTDAFTAWSLLPLAGAMFYAIAHILTRTKCQSVAPVVLAYSLKLSMFAAGLIASGAVILWQPSVEPSAQYPYLFAGWKALGSWEWLILCVLAVFAVIMDLGIAGAYQAAPPSTIATFEYSYLVFVAVWDTLFFSSPPSGLTLAGMAMIIIAGMLVLRQK
ncbi:MAG: hypothetical protein ACR2OJ_10005, partial [Hyphomicrobiales bacterium]